MKLACRPLQIVLFMAIAMLALLAATPARAIECGDTSGPDGTNVPCSCGDTVTSDTVLDIFDDPVVDGNCFPLGLYVAGGVRLDAHQLTPNRLCTDSHSFPYPTTIGLFVLGAEATIFRGITRGCDYGVYGVTDRSTIERVTARDNKLGIFLIGNGNTLLYNLCRRNGPPYGGIFVVGDANRLQNNYCHENYGDGVAVTGNGNSLFKNECYHNGNWGIFVLGDANTLERNVCKESDADGIRVEGSFNFLGHNQGRKNAGHGIFATGGDNLTDQGNYATENALKPDCSIDGQSVPGTGGRHC